MPFDTAVPDSIDSHLRLADGEQVRFVLESDWDHQGRFASEWLVLTDRRILAVGAAGVAASFDLPQILEVRVDELHGSGRLMALAGDGEHVLINYSALLIAEFAAACRLLNDAVHNRPVILPDPENIDTAICARCRMPLPERGQPCISCNHKRRTLLRLMGLMAPYRSRLIALMCLTLCSVAAQLVPPYCFMQITDRVIKLGLRAELAWWILAMVASFLVLSGLRLIANTINAWLANHLIGDMRLRLHQKLLHLRMGYHNRHPSGELVGRVASDCGRLQHFLIDGLPWVLVNTVSFAGIACVLLSINARLAMLVFIPVPLIIFGGGLLHRAMVILGHRFGNRDARMYSHLGESIHGVKSVKAVCQEPRRHQAFSAINGNLVEIGFGIERTWIRFVEVMGLTMATGTVLMWWTGAGMAQDSVGLSDGTPGKVSVGMLIAFAAYMAQFYGPLQWFTGVCNWASRAIASSERIFQILDMPSEDQERPGTRTLGRVKGEIRFEGVRFSYERGKEVIKGIDLTIGAGEMIGLVGRSGSGKSTIISLICRFYEPDFGRILADGVPLAEIRLDAWRRQVGIVMQEPFLFHADITDNIRYGRPEASFEEVVRAAKAAHAHEFIVDKDDGYDTVIGEGGEQLSGGEKQRIAIARAIIADPPVLILDEATSSVDSETEKAIQEAIAHLIRGRTTIAIAHRLATLRNASRLVVIDDGKLVEIGSHDELLAKPDGHFAKLVRLQQEINALRSSQHVWND